MHGRTRIRTSIAFVARLRGALPGDRCLALGAPRDPRCGLDRSPRVLDQGGNQRRSAPPTSFMSDGMARSHG